MSARQYKDDFFRKLNIPFKKGASIFYPHMVKMEGHDHFTQSYFTDIVHEAFKKDSIRFHHFEAHVYPAVLLPLFRIYEGIMESIPFLRPFLGYNIAIITKK